MATTIKLKNGSGAPTAGQLVQGEPALDLTNKRLYTEDSGGTIIEVGSNPTSLTTPTINNSTGVSLQYNGSTKAATTSTGVDVTGTVTADGLSVSNSSLQVKLEEADGTYNPRLITYFDSSGTHLQHTWSSGADSLFVELGGVEGAGVKAMRIQNNDISFYEDTGTTAKFFWDASAEKLYVGGGDISAYANGDLVVGKGAAAGDSTIGLQSAGGANLNKINFGDGSRGDRATIESGSSNYLSFKTYDGSSSTTERARIDSSGNLLVGTSTSGGVGTTISKLSNGPLVALNQNYGNGWTTVSFQYNSSQVGQIYTNTSSTVYATSSDYRLKEDIQDIVNASSSILALKPCNFAWKFDGSRVNGFIAHEVQEIVPEAVTGTKDGMRTEEYEVSPAVLDDEGNVVTEAVMGTREVPDYQGIDQSKLVPLLTKALQEALERIAALEAKVG